MSQHDDSILSAYLDGELDAERHRAVESSLEACPERLATLHDLHSIQELVAELSRPRSPDLSAAIMSRVQGQARRRRVFADRRALPWLIGGLAAAAAIGLLMLWPTRFTKPGAAQLAGAGQGVEPSDQHERIQATRTDPVGAELTDSSSPAQAAEVASLDKSPVKPSRSDRIAVTQSETLPGPDQDDMRRVRSLLEDQELKKVFLVTDQISEPAEAQVASIVEQTTHQNFYKISVAQGIVLDPRHPGKATVFAVVLEQSSLSTFHDRLKSSFKGRIEENDVDPAIALQLADIGQVISFPGHPIGELTTPPTSNLALRHTDQGQPSPAQERSGHDADRLLAGAQQSPGPRPELAEREPSHPGDFPSAALDPAAERSLVQPRGKIQTEGLPREPGRLSPPHIASHDNERPVVVLVWITSDLSG